MVLTLGLFSLPILAEHPRLLVSKDEIPIIRT